MLQGDSFLAPRKSLITFKCPFNKKSISSLLLELPCYRMNRIFKQDLLRRCISVKLYRIFQNTIVHIHYKETHIWEVILFFFFFTKYHSFFKIYIQSPPLCLFFFITIISPQLLFSSLPSGTLCLFSWQWHIHSCSFLCISYVCNWI